MEKYAGIDAMKMKDLTDEGRFQKDMEILAKAECDDLKAGFCRSGIDKRLIEDVFLKQYA